MSGEVQVEKPALAAVVCQRYPTHSKFYASKLNVSVYKVVQLGKIHFAIWKNTFVDEHLKVLPCLKKSQNRKLVYTMNTKLTQNRKLSHKIHFFKSRLAPKSKKDL